MAIPYKKRTYISPVPGSLPVASLTRAPYMELPYKGPLPRCLFCSLLVASFEIRGKAATLEFPSEKHLDVDQDLHVLVFRK